MTNSPVLALAWGAWLLRRIMEKMAKTAGVIF